MVFLETVFVFFRWNYGIFDGALVNRIYIWDFVLRRCVCVYDFYLCQSAALRGPSCWLAVYDVYYFFNWWRSAALYWHYGAVYE